MPELTLYFAEKDEIEFMEFVLQQGAWLVPNLDYERAECALIQSEETFQAYKRRCRLFHILRDSYYCSPLEFRSVEKRRRMIYYVSQRNGGPTIDYVRSVGFREQGRRFISTGFLAHYPTYWDTLKHSMEKAPEPLRDFYTLLATWIKKNSVRIKPVSTTYWVGRHAVEAVRRGVKLDGIRRIKL